VYCLFDGLSRYYVAAEHPELRRPLSYPACVFDDFVTIGIHEERERANRIAAERDRLWGDAVHWRGAALSAWSDAFGHAQELEQRRVRLRTNLKRRNRQVAELRAEVEWMRNSLSWRITRPLRWFRARRSAKSIDAQAADQ
jgi:hypothetical protein